MIMVKRSWFEQDEAKRLKEIEERYGKVRMVKKEGDKVMIFVDKEGV